jgi:hypothetical protein
VNTVFSRNLVRLARVSLMGRQMQEFKGIGNTYNQLRVENEYLRPRVSIRYGGKKRSFAKVSRKPVKFK